MYRIDNSYAAMVDGLMLGLKEGRTDRWMAAAAFWLGRQLMFNAKDFWLATAAKIAVTLPADEQAAIREQLFAGEAAYLDNVKDAWPEIPASVQSVLDTWNPVEETPDPSIVAAQFTASIQKLINAKAAERGYDSIQSAVTYRDDPNPAFAAEGEALFTWRSQVWTYATEELAKVLDGTIKQPTLQDFLASAPGFTWPEATT